MGGCGGKAKIPVHEIILNECYDCLGQQFISSEQQLNEMSNKQKIEGAVKLHARTLADHIADTQNKLKDALTLIRQKLMKNFKEDYGCQWATLIILEILVVHTKDFTPHPRRATLIPGDDYKLDVSMGKDSQQAGFVQNKKKSQNNQVVEGGKNKDFRGQFDEKKVIKIAQKKSKSKEEKKRNKKKKQEKRDNDEQQQQGDDYQVTFFSENLLRFESEFVEMMIAILDKNQNPFYQSSFLQCMSLIERFSAVHKDWYTAERVQFLGDRLQQIIIQMINSVLTAQTNNNKNALNPPVIMQQLSEQIQIPPRSNSNALDSNYLRTITADKDSQLLIRQETVSKNDQGGNTSRKSPQEDANSSSYPGYPLLLAALSKAMKAYSATIEKIRTQGKVFSNENQSDFFMICLNTLRQLEEQQIAQQQPSSSSSAPAQYPFEIKTSALQILKIFSKRCFVLQKSIFLVELIFCFFDSCEWKHQNIFEELLQTVQTVFNTESLVLSFQQDVFIHLLNYLSGYKNFQKRVLSQKNQMNQINSNQVEKQGNNAIGKEVQENGYRNEIMNQDILEKHPNCQKTQVMIKALVFFSKIIAKERMSSQLLVHQISRVVKSFLAVLSSVQEKEQIQKKNNDKNNQLAEDNNEDNLATFDLRKALESAFVQFALKIVVDSPSLLGLLLEISNDVCDRLSGSPKIKSYTNLNNSSFQGINDPWTTVDKLDDGLQGISGQKKNQLNQQDQEGQDHVEETTMNSKISYGIEGMRLIEVILCNISDVVQGDMGGGYPCEDLLANLAYLTTFKQISILSFKNISQVLILKAKSDRDYKYLSQDNNNNNILQNPHPPGEFSQTCILHILYAILRSLLIVGNQASQVFSAVIVAQYALMVAQQIVSNQETLLIAPVIAFVLKLINEIQKYSTGREINVNTTEVYAREYGSTNNAYFVANILSKLQEDDKQEQEQQQQSINNAGNGNGTTTTAVSMRHPSSYNICQILAYEMIVVLSQAVPGLIRVIQSFKDNEEYTEKAKSLGGIMKELLRCYQEGFDVDGDMNRNYGETNNNNEIVGQLCQHIHNVEFIDSNEIASGEITEQINRAAYDIGITQHLDFDALTAQFTRNFTSAVRSIDIHKTTQKNSANVTGSHSAFNVNNQTNNKNNNIENNNINDSSFASQPPKNKNINLSGVMNTHESTGPLEIEDTQFQNVLNMITNHNHKIPNLFPELPQIDSHRSAYSQNQRNNNINNNSQRKSSEIEVQIN